MSEPEAITEIFNYRRFLMIRGEIPKRSTDMNNKEYESDGEYKKTGKRPSSPSTNDTKRKLLHSPPKIRILEPEEKKCSCESTALKIIDDKFAAFEQKNAAHILQLTNEVLVLRKEIRSLRAEMGNMPTSILSNSPFETKEQFLEFECELQTNVEKFNELRRIFLQMKCLNPKKFVRQSLSKIMIDEVAEQFCWRGTKEKGNARSLSVTSALKLAFQSLYKDVGEDVFDQTVKKHFQYAKDRRTKKTSVNNEVECKL